MQSLLNSLKNFYPSFVLLKAIRKGARICLGSILGAVSEEKLRFYRDWDASDFQSPSPHFIKQRVVLRNGIKGSTYIETGTYLGLTTELLASQASRVFTLEPSLTLYEQAKLRLSKFENVECLNGSSEDLLPILIPKISGAVTFWLDGHYSGGDTYKGINDTPILKELEIIAQNLDKFSRVALMIDDIRLFENESLSYPNRDFLVKWALSNNFWWNIEHDIFIAKK
jgi:hypothetical protein